MRRVCEDVLRKMKAEHGGTPFSIMALEFKRCFYHQTRNRCNHNNCTLIRSQSLFMKPCGTAAQRHIRKVVRVSGSFKRSGSNCGVTTIKELH